MSSSSAFSSKSLLSEYFTRNNENLPLFGITNTICIVVLALTLLRSLVFKKPKRNDGRVLPPTSPYDGSTIVQKIMKDHDTDFVTSLMRSMGKFVLLPVFGFNANFFLIADHQAAKAILDDPKNRRYEEGYTFVQYGVGGKNFFTSDHERSEHVRKNAACCFSSRCAQGLLQIVDQEISKWISCELPRQTEMQEKTISTQRFLDELFVRIAARCVLDYELTKEEEQLFATRISQTQQEYFNHIYLYPWRRVPGLRHIFPGVRQADKANQAVRDLIKKIIAKKRLDTEKSEDNVLKAFLDDKEYQSDEDRISDLLVLWDAFRVTGLGVLWIIYHLSQHPVEQAKLRSELSHCDTRKDMYSNPFLQCIIRESIRLHHPGPFSSVTRLGKDFLVDGSNYYLPKGSICMFVFRAVDRDPGLFERPDEFLPRRWLSMTSEAKEAFLPFSTGRRNCLGQTLARKILPMITTELFLPFEVCLKEKGFSVFHAFEELNGAKVSFRRVEAPSSVSGRATTSSLDGRSSPNSVVHVPSQGKDGLTSILLDDPLEEWFFDKEPLLWPMLLKQYNKGDGRKTNNPFGLCVDKLESFSDKLSHTFLPLKDPSLDKAARHIMQAGGGGKKLRPMMVFLMPKTLAPPQMNTSEHTSFEDVYDKLAQVVEIIHTASLIHDDVLDESDTRRGEPAAHKLTGSKVAILAGDCLLSKGIRILAASVKSRPYGSEVVEIMAACVEGLATGEVLQLGDQKSFDKYLRKTFYKAGCLMACACMSVALLGDHSKESKVVDACYRYGKHVGIAFQLADDVLDFQGKVSLLGKPKLNDLKAGLATAPVLFAAGEFRELYPLIDRRFSEDGDVDQALSLVMKSKGIQRTVKLARVHAEYAVLAAKEIGVGDHNAVYHDALRDLAIMATQRIS